MKRAFLVILGLMILASPDAIAFNSPIYFPLMHHQPISQKEVIIQAINNHRQHTEWPVCSYKDGPNKRTLVVNDILSNVAQSHAEAISAGSFDYSLSELLAQKGYAFGNIFALGDKYDYGEQAVQAWLSDNEIAFEIRKCFTDIGVGVDGYYVLILAGEKW